MIIVALGVLLPSRLAFHKAHEIKLTAGSLPGLGLVQDSKELANNMKNYLPKMDYTTWPGHKDTWGGTYLILTTGFLVFLVNELELSQKSIRSTKGIKTRRA